MTKYYDVIARIDGQIEKLFGSFVREDCISEIECEGPDWSEQGYRQIRILPRETNEQPDPTVYKDDIEDGLLIIQDDIRIVEQPSTFNSRQCLKVLVETVNKQHLIDDGYKAQIQISFDGVITKHLSIKQTTLSAIHELLKLEE
jgi:hypothetical protein